jgi:hypothetical protein
VLGDPKLRGRWTALDGNRLRVNTLAEIAEDFERMADEYYADDDSETQRDAAIRDTWNQAADILHRTTNTSLAEIAEDFERRADEYHNRLESADGTQRDADAAIRDTWNQAADVLRTRTIKPLSGDAET